LVVIVARLVKIDEKTCITFFYIFSDIFKSVESERLKMLYKWGFYEEEES